MEAEYRGGQDDRLSFWSAVRMCSGTAADRRNQYRFVILLLAWAIGFVGVTWILENREELSGVAAWGLAVAPTLFALLALAAYLRFLRETDEFVRKIQIEGLAFGFGGGLIFATGYQVLESAGAPSLETSAIISAMMFSWAAGQLIGVWRYR